MKLANSWAEVATLYVSGRSNLKLGELVKTTGEIKNISSSIGSSQNELVNLNKQLVEIQSKIVSNQNYQISLQQKQILLNEQQLIIQKKQLAEQEIQTSIQTRKELDRLKQQELKKAVYSVNEEIIRIDKIENNITKYFELALLIKDVSRNNIVANEFDNITDKEYAANVLILIEVAYKNIIKRLNDDENQDIFEIEELLKKVSKNMSILSNAEKDNLENDRLKIVSYIESLENELNEAYKAKRKMKLSTIITAISVIIINTLISILFAVFPFLAKSHNDNILYYVIIALVIFVSPIFIIFVFIMANSSQRKKIKRTITLNQNEISERRKHLIYYDDIIGRIQVAQFESKEELRMLMEQNSMLVNKYPFVRNRLFSDVETYLN